MTRWQETNRYGKANPVIIWSRTHSMNGRMHKDRITLSLHGKDKMRWDADIWCGSKHMRKSFRTDELARSFIKKFMRMH
jgi:hypothetical protein